MNKSTKAKMSLILDDKIDFNGVDPVGIVVYIDDWNDVIDALKKDDNFVKRGAAYEYRGLPILINTDHSLKNKFYIQYRNEIFEYLTKEESDIKDIIE